MAAFSVPFSSLCVSTMTSMVLAPTAAPADAVLAVPPQIADQGLDMPVPPSFLSGFRVEGSPEVEVVFGDSDFFKRHIDRFTELARSMETARRSFSRSVQSAVAALGHGRPAQGKRAACPVDRVARQVYEARRDGETYRALGAELEAEQTLINQLDELGETAALTPDYRWKVNQVAGRYRQAVTDLKEMRLAFMVQLGGELEHRGCSTAELVKRGAELVASAAPVESSEDGADQSAARPGDGEPVPPPVPATTITFYVDNRACPIRQRVYLEGQLLGEVAAEARAAFQALAGRHSLCLISGDSPARCGDPGTLRAAFLHDGWSVAMHCASPLR